MHTSLRNLWPLVIALVSATAQGQSDTTTPEAAIERGLAFLSREVPKWSGANKCYSCHNNGDGARVLYIASRLGFRVDLKSAADTTKWLSEPDRWQHNGGEGKFNNKKLAAIQFGAALVEAVESRALKDKEALPVVAKMISDYQNADGSWTIDAEGSIGSPATYGSFLATASSLRILSAADPNRFKSEIEKSRRWLTTTKPETVLDAGATLIGIGGQTDEASKVQHETCLKLIRQGQNKAGGWGPFVTSAREPFDTAIVMLGLHQLEASDDRAEMIRRGRRYLVDCQYDDGSWPETTRPAGADSYAQCVSTTAWSTLALIESIVAQRTVKTKNPASR